MLKPVQDYHYNFNTRDNQWIKHIIYHFYKLLNTHYMHYDTCTSLKCIESTRTCTQLYIHTIPAALAVAPWEVDGWSCDPPRSASDTAFVFEGAARFLLDLAGAAGWGGGDSGCGERVMGRDLLVEDRAVRGLERDKGLVGEIVELLHSEDWEGGNFSTFFLFLVLGAAGKGDAHE